MEEYNSDDEELKERPDDNKPLVVVVKPGDLTAEEAEREKERLERGKFCFPEPSLNLGTIIQQQVGDVYNPCFC